MKPEKKERQKPEELIHPRSPRVKRPEGAATGGSQRGLHRIPQILLWFARFPGVSAPRGSRIPEITGTARPRLKAESDPRSSTIRIRTSGKKGSSSAGSGQANVPSFSLAFWLDAHSDSALAPQSNAKASQERVERLSRSRACNTDLSHSGSL